MSTESNQPVVDENDEALGVELNTDAYQRPTTPVRGNKNHTWAYMTGLSDAERLQSVYEFLRSAHRWSLKDFIRYIAVKDRVPYAHSAKTRVKQLRKAI